MSTRKLHSYAWHTWTLCANSCSLLIWLICSATRDIAIWALYKNNITKVYLYTYSCMTNLDVTKTQSLWIETFKNSLNRDLTNRSSACLPQAEGGIVEFFALVWANMWSVEEHVRGYFDSAVSRENVCLQHCNVVYEKGNCDFIPMSDSVNYKEAVILLCVNHIISLHLWSQQLALMAVYGKASSSIGGVIPQ